MDILTADMECFYDNEYTLSKMTTEAYLRDPRFEEILWSIKWNDTPSFWLLPERAEHFFKNEVNWSKTALLCHHSHFDGARLNWAHGIKPALHIDTLSMAREIDGPKAGNSLHDLCTRHGIGAKGDYVTFAKGKRFADFSVAELHEYGKYGCNDTDRTYDLAQIFLPQLPLDELRIIDLTIRMFTEPVFRGDVAKLRDAVTTERQNKIAMLQQIGLICPACNGTGQQPDLLTAATPCKKCDGMGVNKKPLNSNDQFADLLRKAGAEPETKTSPTTGEQIYAFAKTDPYMQSLVDDEDDEVRVLAETRLAVKSNIIETRAAKFAACAERGAMPVYLSHAGAHTLRPSGGDGMNWLNMSKHNAKRPEMMVLRQSILPPPGHKILAPDSGQGEARIVAWLANQMDLVEAFAQGRDIYSEAATDIYRRPVDRKFELPDGTHPDYIQGQVGKICLGEGTLVLTQRGWVPIEVVEKTDQLWDGEEWIRHQGLVNQGVQTTLKFSGLSATPDHAILTEHGWEEWHSVITRHSLFQSALDLVNLPFSDGGVASPPEGVTSTRHFAGVPAGQKLTSLGTHLRVGGLLDATPALRKRLPKNAGSVTKMLCLTRNTALVCLADWLRRLHDVTRQPTNTSNTMGSAGLAFAPNGAQTEQLSYDTSRRSQDGTFLNWKWIAKTWMGTMSRAIFGSSPKLPICKISGKSQPCNDESKNSKQRMRTYDLACAGPRSRFTVLTDRGPLIVHNCILSFGFGSGWYTASLGFLKGILGAPPIQFFEHDLRAMQIDESRFLNNPKKIEIVQAMPSRLDFRDRVIHCAVVDGMVQRYRERYAEIKKFWGTMELVINAMMRGEEMAFGAHGVMRTGKECIYLPNGTQLNYRGIERDNNGDATYWDGRKRTKIYGSLACENVVQALHRAIVAEQMLEIADAGIKVALWPYDEIVAVVPEDAAELALEFMIQTMKKSPAWAVGLPLTAEGKIGNTYAEC